MDKKKNLVIFNADGVSIIISSVMFEAAGVMIMTLLVLQCNCLVTATMVVQLLTYERVCLSE